MLKSNDWPHVASEGLVVMVSGDAFTVMDRASLAVWDDGVE
jgi:hypothetical protein